MVDSFSDYLKRAAKLTKSKVDSELARHVAFLLSARAATAAQIATGKASYSVTDVLALDEALRKYLPPPKRAVRLTFCSCPRCDEPDDAEVKSFISRETALADARKREREVQRGNAKPTVASDVTVTSAAPPPSPPSAAPPPKPPQNPRWSGTGDHAFAKAVDLSASAPGWVKRGVSGPPGMSGMWGGVSRPKRAPGEPDFRVPDAPPTKRGEP
jgi:hypothetical protein